MPYLFCTAMRNKNNANFFRPFRLFHRSIHTIVLGGTHQLNDYNRNVDAGDRKFIYEGCIALNASIKRAEIIKEMVGLRPGRNQVRLERDTYTTSEYCCVMMINRFVLLLLWLIYYCHSPNALPLICHSRMRQAATNYS